MKNKLKLAVLGSPISHSRSPQLHASFARDCGIADFSYERIETDCEALPSTVKRLVCEDYDGFNCTMPLKTDMAGISHFLSDEARILRSVNTVAIKDGEFYSDTTDGTGILMAVRRGYGDMTISCTDAVKGRRVLLLGAGGAARSAALSLHLAGARLTIANRSLEVAYSLKAMLGSDSPCISLSDSEALLSAAAECDILINCTSLGMSGNAEFDSLTFLDGAKVGTLVVDAVYNPLETALLKYAKDRGLHAVSGLWMLVYQGAAAFEKWSGILPDEAACERAFELIK